MQHLDNSDNDNRELKIKTKPKLSLVIPCYNEEQVIPHLLEQLMIIEKELIETKRILGKINIILVDDGSTDSTWSLICKAAAYYNITGLKLSSNQGHQAALLAGLMHSNSDITISLDADLQDDPNAIKHMIDAWYRGAEIVYGVRSSRLTDTKFKRNTANLYYRLLKYLGANIIPDHADYRLMSKKAISSLSKFSECNLFLRGIIRNLGYKSEIVTYERLSRFAGETKYPLSKMLALAIDGITSLSIKPLRLITLAGIIFSTVSFVAFVWAIGTWAIGNTVAGWTSIIAAIYFLGGLHLAALGVIGEYIGKIYIETKARPRYIVDEIIESDK